MFFEVRDTRVCYKFEIKRKVTIIKGDSGTGKSTLVEMIQYSRRDGVFINTNASSYGVFTSDDNGYATWRDLLAKANGTVFFADESADYVSSNEFVSLFNASNCYLVLVNRRYNGRHDYAIDSIFRLESKKSGKYTVTKFYNLYNDVVEVFKPDMLLMEDSKGGKELLEKCFSFPIETSEGNTKLVAKYKELRSTSKYSNIYMLIDGAAYGRLIEGLLFITANDRNLRIYAPESLEYLILCTNIFNKFCRDELEHTENYASVDKYLTWERYYTALLRRVASEHFYNSIYEKGKLNGIFASKQLPKQLRLLFKDIEED